MTDLKQIITALIELNLRTRAEFFKEHPWEKLQYAMSQATFACEFCTVHVNPGRRAGKTTAILDLMKSDDALLVHSYDAKERVRREAWTYASKNIFAMNELVSPNFIPNHFRGRRWAPRIIWVDEPELCFSSVPHNFSLGHFYETFTQPPYADLTTQTFVLVGQ